MESQYSQFKEDITKKTQGGTAFITDYSKKDLLAIGHGEASLPPKPDPKSIAKEAVAAKVAKAKML